MLGIDYAVGSWTWHPLAEAGKFLRGRARSWILPSRRVAHDSPAE